MLDCFFGLFAFWTGRFGMFGLDDGGGVGRGGMDGWGEGELRVVAPYADDLEEIDALVSDAFGRYLAHTREGERWKHEACQCRCQCHR